MSRYKRTFYKIVEALMVIAPVTVGLVILAAIFTGTIIATVLILSFVQ